MRLKPLGSPHKRNHAFNDDPHMLNHALNYARRGYKVFPCHELVMGACSCGNPDCGNKTAKHPRTVHGVLDATTNTKKIREWWAIWPNANIGLSAEGLIVVDIDADKGGFLSLEKTETESGALPSTRKTDTGGGGNHYLFRRNGYTVKNDVSLKPGIDIKTNGGYIVAPPSLHRSGKRYAWSADSARELAEFPKTWIPLLHGDSGNGDNKARFNTAGALSGVPEGKRDATCFGLACKLRNADVPYDIALKLVLEAAANCTPAFSADIAKEKVERAYRKYKPGESDFQPFTKAPEPTPSVIHWAREALEPQPVKEWIAHDLFGAGDVVAQVGDAGAKKTWTALDLSVCVALGKEWLGRRVSRSNVLIVDEESGERRLKMRLGDCMRGHDAGPDLPIAFTTMAGITLTSQGGADCLGEIITETKAQFVVMDALQDFTLGMDENSGQELAPAIHMLKVIAEKLNCAIWLLHHLNKQGGYRGHSSIKGLIDVMLKCESATDSGLIQFTAEKSRDSLITPFAAMAHFDLGRFWLSDADPKQQSKQLSRPQRYVLDFLKVQPDCIATMDIIKDKADSCSPQSARQAVYSLASMGLLERTDSGGRGVAATYRLKGDFIQ